MTCLCWYMPDGSRIGWVEPQDCQEHPDEAAPESLVWGDPDVVNRVALALMATEFSTDSHKARAQKLMRAARGLSQGNAVDSWCEACGRKHVMRGQVEPCAGCGANRFVFRSPAGETP